MRKLTVLKRSLALVAVLWLPLKSHSVHKVLIAYRKRWDDGNRKSCFLGPPGGSTVRRIQGEPDLPELDRDRVVEGEDLQQHRPKYFWCAMSLSMRAISENILNPARRL